MATTMDSELALTDIGSTAPVRGHGAGESRQDFSLPRADGGKDAWLFLAGCFSIEALVWGFPFSFGVFQEYYSTHEPFSLDPRGIASIGTSATGIMYLSAPLFFALYQKWPRIRRLSCALGLVIISGALVASSFATTVWQLILTQGVLYAIGGSLLYAPVIIFLDEWFVHRKGFAYGVMYAGTGTSGAIVPFVMSHFLTTSGSQAALRVWAVVLVVLSGPLLIFVKPRIPVSSSTQSRPFDLRFLRGRTFWMLQLGNIIQGLGYFIPSIYLPTYVKSLGLSGIAGPLTIALFNTSSVFGAVIVGSLSDRVHVTTVIILVTIGATISVFLIWGFAISLPLLCIFSLLYGVTAGGFSSTYPGTIIEVKKHNAGADLGIVFGCLAAGRGIGAVLSGPLSEALLSSEPWLGEASLGYGTGYGGLIVFTGITAALGGFGFLAKRIGWL